jgi:hypothetical protein
LCLAIETLGFISLINIFIPVARYQFQFSFYHSAEIMSQQQSQQQQQQQQQQTVSNTPILRRAVYVHVSDLISAYNVDHKRLELELARVKSLQGLSVTSTTSSMLPIPAPDEASVSSQKRLQPPRGGYNLCV